MKKVATHRLVYFFTIILLFLFGNSFIITGKCYEIDASGTVTYIVDGDTLDVSSVGRIRLADINTPEMGEPGSSEAKIYLTTLIYQEIVFVDIDDLYGTDPYGRIVAVIYKQVDSSHVKNINKAMLDSGYADIWNFENEFDPYSWNLYEPYPPSSNPPPYDPDPPPYDPEPPPYDPEPEDPLNFGNLINPATVIGLSLSLVGVGGLVAYGVISTRRNQSKRSTPERKPISKVHYQSFVKDITPTSKNVNITGKIKYIKKSHTFRKKNGIQGKVSSFYLEDDTGSIRVVLWNENSKFLDDPSLVIGSSISLKGFNGKLNKFQGAANLELHSSNHSQMIIINKKK